MATPSSPTEYFAHICSTVAAEIELRLDDATPLDLVRVIVAGLPKGWQLRFYDREYPSKSDPGAYPEFPT
jgi:hypothetical protein